MRPHLLLAEDEFLAALVLEDFLSSRGYRVTVTSNGLEALAAYRTAGADVLLTDWRMPKMDGGELIGQLRALTPELPVVVISGHVDSATEVDVPGTPPVCLPKPVNLDVLAATLAKMVPDRP